MSVRKNFCLTPLYFKKLSHLQSTTSGKKLAVRLVKFILTMKFFDSHPKVRVGDTGSLEKKIRKFAEDGPEHMLVIADFDYTLSRTKNVDGEQCCQTYGVFERHALTVSPEYGKLFAELTEKYLPIELDALLSFEEKAPYMIEWWQKSNEHILTANHTEEAIERIVKESPMHLRCGVDVMVQELERQNIPLVILSAGIGNIIEICLRLKLGKVPNNVHIISNMMHFDEKGIACGFSDPLIHTFCKNGTMIEECSSLRGELDGRYNILLLGDSLGDLSMADGYISDGNLKTTLKIGFLNGCFDKHYEKFVESFDVVLVDDQTMDIPRHILDICVKRKERTNSFKFEKLTNSFASD